MPTPEIWDYEVVATALSRVDEGDAKTDLGGCSNHYLLFQCFEKRPQLSFGIASKGIFLVHFLYPISTNQTVLDPTILENQSLLFVTFSPPNQE
jgi:hypothetical protein